jgi:peptide/nickel transport system substrate-binding protein
VAILGWCDSALAQKSGGALRIFHRDNPTSASILEETASSTVVAFMPVFNNLVMFDPAAAQNTPESIIPDLAESWRWNDDKTELTFKLRKGVTWHDGFPFTSSDVECTFNLWTGRARNKLRSNPRGAWFGNINFVHAPNDYEVTIHLNRPQPALLSMLASGFSPIYPCHVPLAQMRTKPIGTGPFKLDSFSQFDRIRLVRNPRYWKEGRPYLDAIEFSVVTSRSTALLSFVAGRYDMTFPNDVTMAQLRDVRRQSPRVQCEATGMNNNTNLMLNRDAPPFNNPDIRRALALALDRNAFMEALTDASGAIGGHLQPPPDGLWGMSARSTGQRAGLRRGYREESRDCPCPHAQGGLRSRSRAAAEDLHAGHFALPQPGRRAGQPAPGNPYRRDPRCRRDLALVHAPRTARLHARARDDRQRHRRSRPDLLRELLLPLGA